MTLVAGGGREELAELATQYGHVDLVIPRGGEGLKKALEGVATVPVIYAASGNCHVYVDRAADLERPLAIAVNAKTQRPGVCNAAETLLVHADVAEAFVPRGARGAARARASSCASTEGRGRWPGPALGDRSSTRRDEDWDTEYLALVLAVGVVDSLEEAIEHVSAHGSGHSEAIVTERLGGGAGVRARRRRGVRLRQRLDAVHRRRRVRDGRGDRQLDAEAARARADRAARAVQLQVRGRRRRPRAHVGARCAASGAADADGAMGLLGGTFNPPHLGHLICAQEALEQLGLDRVLLLPAAVRRTRRWRTSPARTCGSRCAGAAVAGDERLGVCDARGRARRGVVLGGYAERAE